MPKSALLRMSRFALLFCAAAAVGQTTFTSLASLIHVSGGQPYAMSLVQGLDGNFYGTTNNNGAHGWGTVFKVTPAGKITTIYSFCALPGCADGSSPEAGLVLGIDGNLYGTTYDGGANLDGTFFKITPGGTLTTVRSFTRADGEEFSGGLVQGTDGNFYGTTIVGGNSGAGTVFKITPTGNLTSIHDFHADGGPENPFAGLVLGADGNFYGTTYYGGSGSWGTVFKITPAGILTTLHNFDSTDGGEPIGRLVQASNGNFYGTTQLGGTSSSGTVFEITPGGALTTLYSFCAQISCTDGGYPVAGLVQGTDGNFYGATYAIGTDNFGTIYEITGGGALTTMHIFDVTDGASPASALLQSTNGKFYGTTEYGGSEDIGTVFEISTGLRPFVATLPTSASVGTVVTIVGNNLAKTTSVSFNGTAAVFTVVSSSEVTATVPAGATTGTVTLTSSVGKLNSNVEFRVTP
jgi:uncharacterized repeat protein (TIGR03803 family)